MNGKHNRHKTQYFSLKEQKCYVKFKYNQMMISIQQFLPIYFYSNSTDRNIFQMLALIGSHVEGSENENFSLTGS